MVKVRQDAWSHEDDLLLAETVLRHIREGSTQLNAFEEVGDKLNRTSAACGFRWNAEIRQKYDDAIDLAKRQRKEKKRALERSQTKRKQPAITFSENYHQPSEKTFTEEPGSSTITIDSVIEFLKQIKKDYYVSNQSKITLSNTQKENERLNNRVIQLESQLAETERRLNTIQEDYQVFVQIMDRARKMTVLDDKGSMKTPAFRMDKNGNLEQIAQGSN